MKRCCWSGEKNNMLLVFWNPFIGFLCDLVPSYSQIFDMLRQNWFENIFLLFLFTISDLPKNNMTMDSRLEYRFGHGGVGGLMGAGAIGGGHHTSSHHSPTKDSLKNSDRYKWTLDWSISCVIHRSWFAERSKGWKYFRFWRTRSLSGPLSETCLKNQKFSKSLKWRGSWSCFLRSS